MMWKVRQADDVWQVYAEKDDDEFIVVYGFSTKEKAERYAEEMNK